MKDINENIGSTKLKSLQTREGKEVNIPFEGSLGLLALGDVGLLLWRDAKQNLQTPITISK